jgi:WhiB family redox-sensing transcriptional regulator
MDPLLKRKEWQKDANCLKVSTNVFFEGNPESTSSKFCSTCPVKLRCKDYALLHEEYGYWNSSREQRRKFRRDKKAFFKLAKKAYKEGWLEKHALVSRNMLEDLKYVTTKTQRKKQDSLVLEGPVSFFEVVVKEVVVKEYDWPFPLTA